MLVFSFVLPNFVWAKVAVVNVNGACDRVKNELPTDVLPPLPLELAVETVALPGELLGFFVKLPELELATAAGDGADVGGELCGDDFGLKDNTLIDELTASIGRKHCASGLNVFVTSRSAELVSSA